MVRPTLLRFMVTDSPPEKGGASSSESAGAATHDPLGHLGELLEHGTAPLTEGESQAWQVLGEGDDGPLSLAELDDDARRQVRGWCMYDWANSAFATSITAAILPAFYGFLFLQSQGSDGWNGLPGETLWSFGVGLATAVVAVTSPVLGVIADHTALKTKLLKIYATAGAAATTLMVFAVFMPGHEWAWLLAFYLLAQVGFAGGNVFYNSLLPTLVPSSLYNSVSSRGFAYGYIGGGLLLAIHLVAIVISGNNAWVIRIALASVGVWWYGWALWTFRTVKEPRTREPVKGLTMRGAARLGFGELAKTGREVRRFKQLFLYLIAFLLFNDGIQTVLAVAGVYASISLGVPLVFLLGTILILQFVGAPGALTFEALAHRVGTKPALITALFVWLVVLMLAIGAAALEPERADQHDYQLQWEDTGYTVVSAPELADEGEDAKWGDRVGELEADDVVNASAAAVLLAEAVDSRWSVHVEGGASAGAVIGDEHPSQLGEGPLDGWPGLMRDKVWQPLGLSAGLQFLVIGVFVGFAMGGSQALARSQFAAIIPSTRAGEFFGFFGFMSKAASVIGPWLFALIAIYDQRMGILAIFALVVLGLVAYWRVDVDEGASVARAAELADRAERASASAQEEA